MTAGLGKPRLGRAGAIAAWEVEKAGRRVDAGVNVAGARRVPSPAVYVNASTYLHTAVPHHALVKRVML